MPKPILRPKIFFTQDRIDEKCIKQYLHNGGDPNYRHVDSHSSTLLTFILRIHKKIESTQKRRKLLQLMHFICNQGASWELVDGKGESPARIAENAGLSTSDVEFILSKQQQRFFCILGQVKQTQEVDTILQQLTMLLLKGVDPNGKNIGNRPKTPLTLLLRQYQSADLDQRQRLQRTLLILTLHGAQWTQADGAGRIPIQLAQSMGCLSDLLIEFSQPLPSIRELDQMEEKNDDAISINTRRLFSTLPTASLMQLYELLQAGTDPNAHNGKKGQTPLTFLLKRYPTIAVEDQPHYRDMMGLLIDYGAKWTKANGSNETPKQLAQSNNIQLHDLPPFSIPQTFTSISASEIITENQYSHIKKLPPYILFLGSGNMSFELSFAQKHAGIASYMVITTYETEQEAERKYNISSNKQSLIELGATILHSIDATQLHQYPFIHIVRFQDIYFTHPHTGNYQTTPQLIRQFLASASQIQPVDSQLRLIRIRGSQTTPFPHEDPQKGETLTKHYQKLYGLTPGELIAGYQLINKHRFNTNRYPGFKHVKTKKKGSAPNVADNNSIECAFIKTASLASYRSDQISTDADSDMSDLDYITHHQEYYLLLCLHAAAERDYKKLSPILNKIDQDGLDKNRLTMNILKRLASQCDVVTGLHNLACFYENLAWEFREQKIATYNDFLCTAETIFNTAQSYLGQESNIALSTEFARFLVRLDRHDEAIPYLEQTIQKHSSETLEYSKVERYCFDSIMRQAIETHEELSIPVVVLSHFLLVKTYIVRDQLRLAKQHVKDLQSLFDNDTNAYSLYDNCICVLIDAYVSIGELTTARTICQKIVDDPRVKLAQTILTETQVSNSEEDKPTEENTSSNSPYSATLFSSGNATTLSDEQQPTTASAPYRNFTKTKSL